MKKNKIDVLMGTGTVQATRGYPSLFSDVENTPAAYVQSSIFLKKAYEEICPTGVLYLSEDSDALDACLLLYDRRVDNILTYQEYFSGHDSQADSFFDSSS